MMGVVVETLSKASVIWRERVGAVCAGYARWWALTTSMMRVGYSWRRRWALGDKKAKKLREQLRVARMVTSTDNAAKEQ